MHRMHPGHVCTICDRVFKNERGRRPEKNVQSMKSDHRARSMIREESDAGATMDPPAPASEDKVTDATGAHAQEVIFPVSIISAGTVDFVPAELQSIVPSCGFSFIGFPGRIRSVSSNSTAIHVSGSVTNGFQISFPPPPQRRVSTHDRHVYLLRFKRA